MLGVCGNFVEIFGRLFWFCLKFGMYIDINVNYRYIVLILVYFLIVWVKFFCVYYD